MSDPSMIGVEQVAATQVPAEFLEHNYTECGPLLPHGDLALK